MSEHDEIKYLDAKIQMFTEWMHARRGKAHDTATPGEIAEKFRAPFAQVVTVMQAAHARGLISIYQGQEAPLYVLRSTI